MGFKIIVISDDVVGVKMAGPGIRAWEMGCELSKFFDVTLMVPEYSPGALKADFDIITYSEKRPDDLIEQAKKGDLLIVQGYVLRKFRELSLLKKTIVVDLYVPFVLENMFNYMFKLKKRDRRHVFENDLEVYREQLMRGDLFLVANRDQFNLIAGGLLLLGRIDPEQVSKKNQQVDSILEIPFGFKEIPGLDDRPVLKEKIGFRKSDFIFLWGGVITNWFDPVTLIRAMALIKESHPDIKLLFLSTTHANPLLPGFDMAGMAIEKAKALGVYDRTVFFHEDWVPYETRANYFGAADVGISTHSIHIETRYSFRTRFLDYLNFKLPIVSTEGDYLSESLSEKGALIKVKENDVNGLKNVLLRLYEDKDFYKGVARAVEREREGYTWERVLKPLLGRLKVIENQMSVSVNSGYPPNQISKRKFRRFVKQTFPFIKRCQGKSFFIRLRRYLGQ